MTLNFKFILTLLISVCVSTFSIDQSPAEKFCGNFDLNCLRNKMSKINSTIIDFSVEKLFLHPYQYIRIPSILWFGKNWSHRREW